MDYVKGYHVKGNYPWYSLGTRLNGLQGWPGDGDKEKAPAPARNETLAANPVVTQCTK